MKEKKNVFQDSRAQFYSVIVDLHCLAASWKVFHLHAGRLATHRAAGSKRLTASKTLTDPAFSTKSFSGLIYFIEVPHIQSAKH